MIIFDLDGTLANRDHRLHFVDPARNPDYEFKTFWRSNGNPNNIGKWQKKEVGIFFAADYESFEDACDKDTPNAAVVEVLESLSCETPSRLGYDIEIWSGRTERVRLKTEKWLSRYCGSQGFLLKMRPIGDYTPDEQLKERWLDEALAAAKNIDMVFDDRQKVVDMWRRRGIPCFQYA
jgi:hypothetical protein